MRELNIDVTFPHLLKESKTSFENDAMAKSFPGHLEIQ